MQYILDTSKWIFNHLKEWILFLSSNEYWGFFVDIATILALLISMWTLTQVFVLKRAVRAQRILFSELISLKNILSLLRRASSTIRKNPEGASSGIADEIYEQIGVVEGVLRVLESGENTPIGKLNVSNDIYAGHFSVDFLEKRISEAGRNIDILVFRPTMVINVDIMALIRAAIKRGVSVRFLALSPDTRPSVLEEAINIFPDPKPSGVSSLKSSLKELNSYYQANIANWDHDELQLISIGQYKSYPVIHMIRVDGISYLGFPNTHHSTQVLEKSERPGLRLTPDSPLGEQVGQHFEYLFSSSIKLV